ncbi:UNVERIFIED_CONTAM: hypothetical protein Sradi_3773000 [Sesamum radiatum]|uniref:Uncharacterized protein n=1 Tax=Sesamum radiatum TaxID=300843 RepID=A0AAW2PZY6_SESRA
MSFFVSKLRARLRFPIPSFFRKVSRNLRVLLNQLVPNSIRLLVAFSLVLRYNNLIPTSELFCQCFQLKRTEPGVFHFVPRRGVSFLPTPSPPSTGKAISFLFCLLSPGIFPASRFISLLPPEPGLDADLGSGQGAFIYQAFILRGESLSRASEGSSRSQGEADVRSLEDRVERLQGEIDELKAAKKEAGARCQKEEKEVKRLQREMKALQEEHAEELWVHADRVRKEFSETEEDKNLLKACWAIRLAEHKKSEAY